MAKIIDLTDEQWFALEPTLTLDQWEAFQQGKVIIIRPRKERETAPQKEQDEP